MHRLQWPTGINHAPPQWRTNINHAPATLTGPNGEQDTDFERIEAQRFMSLSALPTQMNSTSSAQVFLV